MLQNVSPQTNGWRDDWYVHYLNRIWPKPHQTLTTASSRHKTAGLEYCWIGESLVNLGLPSRHDGNRRGLILDVDVHKFEKDCSIHERENVWYTWNCSMISVIVEKWSTYRFTWETTRTRMTFLPLLTEKQEVRVQWKYHSIFSYLDSDHKATGKYSAKLEKQMMSVNGQIKLDFCRLSPRVRGSQSAAQELTFCCIFHFPQRGLDFVSL